MKYLSFVLNAISQPNVMLVRAKDNVTKGMKKSSKKKDVLVNTQIFWTQGDPLCFSQTSFQFLGAPNASVTNFFSSSP